MSSQTLVFKLLPEVMIDKKIRIEFKWKDIFVIEFN